MENKTGSAARSGTPQGMKDAMKKATTEMLVLFMLRQKTMYSYEMMQEIARLTDGVLTFNTLYLAVYRLQDHGYIVEQEKRIVDGRARAYLAITETGRTYLAQLREQYALMTGAIYALLAPDGKLYRNESARRSGYDRKRPAALSAAGRGPAGMQPGPPAGV